MGFPIQKLTDQVQLSQRKGLFHHPKLERYRKGSRVGDVLQSLLRLQSRWKQQPQCMFLKIMDM